MAKKLNFYTESVKTFTGDDAGYVGRCREYPYLLYTPSSGAGRDAALSGIKRLVGRLKKEGKLSPTVPKKIVKQKINRIAFVIDRSGSMAHLTHAAVDALNTNIEAIRKEAARTGQITWVTVISFDNTVEILRSDEDVATVRPISYYEVSARGGTALFDAVGSGIEYLKSYVPLPDQDVSYLVISITDGEENASRKYDSFSFNRLLKETQATDLWTFTFLLPPGSKDRFCSRFGIPVGNIREWEATTQGVREYAVANSQGITSYFSSRQRGIKSTKSFYTDLSDLTSKDVKKNLDDISGMVRVLPVDREEDIKTFVEKNMGKYVPGTAFYQLTKDEKKVQDYKQLLVMEKGKKAVFGGPDARSVLGIPDGDLKIKPGNHGNWDVFVQSTSSNRKLVRGTKVLIKI